jgi:hypothetical protein
MLATFTAETAEVAEKANFGQRILCELGVLGGCATRF